MLSLYILIATEIKSSISQITFSWLLYLGYSSIMISRIRPEKSVSFPTGQDIALVINLLIIAQNIEDTDRRS